MNFRALGVASSVLVAAFVVACGGSSRRSGFGQETDPTETADGGGGGLLGANASPNSTGCAINDTAGDKDQDKDFDGDGYALKDDCNECNTGVNKGAFDIPGNGVDDDCNGTVDDEPTDCDDGLSGGNPFDGAKAIGLCKQADASGKEWGVVEAKWVKPDGSSLNDMQGVGIVGHFGVNDPQFGTTMLAISSGKATESNTPMSTDKNYTSGTPSGYPKESPACPNVSTGEAHDGAALEVKIRVPSNAQSFSYQQNFFTMEYPTFICSRFNDFFVTMMDPIPDGLADGNIAFDQDTNPISVNNSLLQVCKAGKYSGKTFPCPLGEDTLTSTGFSDHAATGWLTTAAPVKGGSEITLRFAIWDSGDGVLDSTVLLDDFKWSVEGADTAQTKPSDPK
jgi:hypothetical protein